jgi:hypothetical protein
LALPPTVPTKLQGIATAFAFAVGEEEQESRGIFARCEKALPFFIQFETQL